MDGGEMKKQVNVNILYSIKLDEDDIACISDWIDVGDLTAVLEMVEDGYVGMDISIPIQSDRLIKGGE